VSARESAEEDDVDKEAEKEETKRTPGNIPVRRINDATSQFVSGGLAREQYEGEHLV